MTKKIAIIDDEKSVLILSKAILSSLGYDVKTESDSTKAYDLIKSYKPDLVLLDLVMPHMNGIEIATKIKKDNELKGTTLFAFTGTPMLNEENRIYFEKIILKPYKTEDLIMEIKAFFGD